MLECEGYTDIDPIDEEDLVDVFYAIRYNYRERKHHDRNGFMCHEAGSAQCLALGHAEPEDGWEDDDDHPRSWEGDPLCRATQYEEACTECEGPTSDCEPQRDLISPADFWSLARSPESRRSA